MNPAIEPDNLPATAAPGAARPGKGKTADQSYRGLVWWRFRRNRLAVAGAVIVLTLYFTCAVLPEFFAPLPLERTSAFLEAPPQFPRFVDAGGQFHLRPFVYGLERTVDQRLQKRVWVPNTALRFPLHFFVKGDPYKILGLIPWDRHLFGVDPADPQAHAFILGTDKQGRDVLSRIFFGGRLSLLIGLMGQVLTLALGSTLGAVSGYYGGRVDNLIQRLTEFLAAFPDIPLFMALAAAIPVQWSPIAVYFMLTLILAMVRWGGLARQVRGLVLSLREREYVLAARSFGASDRRLLFQHLLPGTLSHVIVIATLAIPGMILAETALSWLGLGLRPPLTSWGVLLQEVSNVRAIRFAPWLLFPVPFVILTVLAFNMLGDGLRDALDPYGAR